MGFEQHRPGTHVTAGQAMQFKSDHMEILQVYNRYKGLQQGPGHAKPFHWAVWEQA